VTLAEKSPHILELPFDQDIAIRVEEFLKTRGVKVRTGIGVKELAGGINSVELSL
jgi:NADPH-dependent 2,4-dienoyl-CoA reductase/sulfur reductase-like enzyme